VIADTRSYYVTLEMSSIRQSPFAGVSWTELMKMSPNPNAPTYGEAIRQALTSDQANQLEAYLQPLVEHGTGGRSRSANTYVTAVRPKFMTRPQPIPSGSTFLGISGLAPIRAIGSPRADYHWRKESSVLESRSVGSHGPNDRPRSLASHSEAR
jgi:hypothetical protein